MKFPFIINPETGKPDEMVTLTVMTTLVVLTRFLLDGITLSIDKHNITFGHVDALVYAAVLAPILGAHGYIINSKKDKKDEQSKE